MHTCKTSVKEGAEFSGKGKLRDAAQSFPEDDPINMEAVGEQCEKRNETTSVQRTQRAQQAKSCLRKLPNAGDTVVFNAHAYVR